MSAAIARLGLYQPPAHILRAGNNPHARMWRAVCDGCGYATKPREAIGLCLYDLSDHTELEALRLSETPAEWTAA